jgi:hypothetical protein
MTYTISTIGRTVVVDSLRRTCGLARGFRIIPVESRSCILSLNRGLDGELNGVGPGSPVCRGRCGRVWELEAAHPPRATPESISGSTPLWLRTPCDRKSAGSADRWCVTREGVTSGWAPLCDPRIPQGLPDDGPSFCSSSERFAEATVAIGTHAALLAHRWR